MSSGPAPEVYWGLQISVRDDGVGWRVGMMTEKCGIINGYGGGMPVPSRPKTPLPTRHHSLHMLLAMQKDTL